MAGVLARTCVRACVLAALVGHAATAWVLALVRAFATCPADAMLGRNGRVVAFQVRRTLELSRGGRAIRRRHRGLLGLDWKIALPLAG